MSKTPNVEDTESRCFSLQSNFQTLGVPWIEVHEPQDPHTQCIYLWRLHSWLQILLTRWQALSRCQTRGDKVMASWWSLNKEKTSVVRRSNVRTRLPYANHSKHAKSLVCCFSREASSYKLNPAAVEAWDVDWKGWRASRYRSSMI